MYTLSSKLKLFSIILMVVGAIGLIAGFTSAPSTIDEVKQIMASHHDDHGSAAGTAPAVATSTHGTEASHGGGDAHHGDAHYEHVLHQLQNKPWAALYIAAFFFFMIALGVLAFYAIQYAAQAGWSPVLFRVMEAITAYLVPGGIIMFVILGLSGFHMNHLFTWADPEVVAHDALIQAKSGWLNGTGFLIRAAIFLGGWIAYRHFAVKFSRKQDEANEGDITWHNYLYRIYDVLGLDYEF